MKKTLVLIVLTVFVLSAAGSAAAAARQEPAGIPSGRTAAAPGRLFSQVVLRLMDGRYMTGLLLGFEDDAIVLKVGTGETKVRRAEIAQATLERERKIGSLAISGIYLGLVAGNLALRENYYGAPTGYIPSYWTVWSALFDNALYSGAGGAALYLLGLLVEPKEKSIDFSGSEERRSRAWDEVRAFGLGAGSTGAGRWRLTIHSSYVFCFASDRFGDQARGLGYELSGNDAWAGPAANINAIRRFSLSRSIGRRFEVGAAVALLGEPLVEGWYHDAGYTVYRDLRQSVSGTGFYLTGSWLAFGSAAGNTPRMKIGLGLGAAAVKYDRAFDAGTYTYIYYYYYAGEPKSGSPSVRKMLPGALAFIELDIPLYQGLFIGLSADYALFPSVSLPAIPDLGFPAGRSTPGNASLGLAFGWIF